MNHNVKKGGGKNISNSHKIITISFNFTGSMTLQQMEEKNEHKQVTVFFVRFHE